MTPQNDMARLTRAMQSLAKAYGEAITEAFRPLGESVQRMRDQQREQRRRDLT